MPKHKIIQKLKLENDIPTLLIMGGGQGLGPIKTIVKRLDRLKLDFQEIIVTGTNKKLYNSLKKKIKKYKKRILLFGYTDDINELMDASDIIITKPGGLTSAEALTKRIPMIIVKPIPGQEANNASYLTEQKVAVKVDNPKDVSSMVEDLLSNPDKLQRMREASRCISKPSSSLDIARLLLGP
jgi:processive 1,2-diacylglycerol beta-glucosyltransferase